MRTKALRTVDEFEMLPLGCRVIVGCSGGADSMALLHLLASVAAERNISVLAAHVNHCLRGAESDRDEAFVRDWCARKRIPLRVLRKDVAVLAQEQKMNLEACARKVRYRFFEELAKEIGARIATAHTLSDQAETVIMRMVRGSGIRGLCGIPPVRGNIVRPLIACTRAETERYCAERGIPYVTDSSNLCRDYARNRIRLDVMPFLQEINPEVEHAIGRMALLLSEDHTCLDELARTALEEARSGSGYAVDRLLACPAAVRNRAIQKIAEQHGGSPEAVHIKQSSALLLQGYGAICIPGGVFMKVERGTLYAQQEPWIQAMPWEMPFGQYSFLTGWGQSFIIERIVKEEYEKRLIVNNLLFKNAVDYDTISDDAIWRNRRAGDCFEAAGRGVRKTLKKLFCESGEPIAQRSRRLILARGQEVLWLQGYGASQRAAVKPETAKILLIMPKECRND